MFTITVSAKMWQSKKKLDLPTFCLICFFMYRSRILCTLYGIVDFLIVLSKGLYGWQGRSRAIKFFKAPAPPPPTVWALKPPTCQLCTYDLYVSVRNAFDAGSFYYLGKWEGVGPWKLRIFWALWNGIEPIALVMDAAQIKSITHRAIEIIGA